MRILMMSDIHANPWALAAVEQNAGPVDHILCAGDCVSYGPAPEPVIAWLRSCGAIVVRGNHDHAVGCGAAPGASPAKAALAVAMRDWTQQNLSHESLTWLTRLPLLLTWEIAGLRIALVHATFADPLYDYRLTPQAPDELFREIVGTPNADIVLCGHTHGALIRAVGSCTLVNPGSVGQPLDGDPRASYALWEDGHLTLRRVEYDRSELIQATRRVALADDLQSRLMRVVQEARID